MCKFREKNCFETVTLHDCRVDRISLESNGLIFNFYDGFWLLLNNEHNTVGKVIRTGPAQMAIEGLADEVIDRVLLFKSVRLFGRTVLVRRVEADQNKLLDMVNSGQYELEFLWHYRQASNHMHECMLWGKEKRGGWMDCQLFLSAKNTEYRWNEVRPDREW